MNRREFFRWGVSALGAGGLGYIMWSLFHQKTCPVTLLALSSYYKDVSQEIVNIMNQDGLRLKGKKVLLKPNFVEAHPQRPINTNINIIANVAHACLILGAAEVVIGEAAGHRRDPWFSVLNPSLRAVLDKRVRCLDLNYSEAIAVSNRGTKTGFSHFFIARPVIEADILIDLPKLKTHHWMGVTLGLKNLFGILPGIYYGWPKNPLHFQGIDNSILDLAQTIKIDYTIVDGVIGMEGDGPILGTPKNVGTLILGPNPLAVDATAARIMGFDPHKISYLLAAGRFFPGLNESTVFYRGVHPRQFATKFACLADFTSCQGGPFWSS